MFSTFGLARSGRGTRRRAQVAKRFLAAAALVAPMLARAAQPEPFVSADVLAPEMRVHMAPAREASTDLYTFIGVRGATAMERGNPGPYILDSNGEVVWYGGIGNVLNVGRHMYQGSPVIAYYTGGASSRSIPVNSTDWLSLTGSEEHPGYGHGHWKLFDESYKLVAVVEAQPEATLANATDPHDVRFFPFSSLCQLLS